MWTVSDLALIGGGFGFALHQYGTKPPAQQVERALAGVVVLPDGPQVLARRRVVARRHVREARVREVEAAQDPKTWLSDRAPRPKVSWPRAGLLSRLALTATDRRRSYLQVKKTIAKLKPDPTGVVLAAEEQQDGNVRTRGRGPQKLSPEEGSCDAAHGRTG